MIYPRKHSKLYTKISHSYYRCNRRICLIFKEQNNEINAQITIRLNKVFQDEKILSTN